MVGSLSITTPRLRRDQAQTLVPAAPRKSIGGRRLLRRLGVGGMSEVYLAYDQVRHCPVAVKVLTDELSRNPTFVQRFHREGDLGRQIEHPNVVRCLESGQDAETGGRFLVLEYVKGQSAQTRLERGGPLPVADAIAVTLDIARALEELHHRGFVHRDVKPGNILISEDGRAKLADLGVAKKLVDTADLTSIDQGIGTPFYMPWEQSLNASLVDSRSDLFALGATFYHLVTGKVPFPGKDVAEVAQRKDSGVFEPACKIQPKLPATVDDVLAKLMARMPAERFQTASELIGVLTASGLAGVKKPPPLAETEVPPAVTRPDMKPARKGERPVHTGPLWNFQYRQGIGWKRGKARTSDIIQWFEDGILPNDFFLAPAGQLTCRHFRTFDEFRGLKRAKPVAPPPTRRRRRRGLGTLALGIGVAVVLTATVSLILHFIWGN